MLNLSPFGIKTSQSIAKSIIYLKMKKNRSNTEKRAQYNFALD